MILTAGTAAAAVAAACGGDDNEAEPTAVATGGIATPTLAAGSDNGATGLHWFGQAMFLLDLVPAGRPSLLDPFNDIGYTVPPPLNTDAATISHEHPDHNNDALGGSTATVLRGLTADGWADIDETVGDVRIRTVQTYHDDMAGRPTGAQRRVRVGGGRPSIRSSR